ncbi:MAG: ABC transporter permease [Acidobacteriia bacterium]|nr:ABC transporter permease [Terriglobia bacterium]
MLRKTPWFAGTAVAILAIAMGSNLAVFNLIDVLVLRKIPVEKPEELATISAVGPQGPLATLPSTVLAPLRKEKALNGVCGFFTPRIAARIQGTVATSGILSMTPECFGTLGVATQIGRPFQEGDDRADAPDVVVLTASLWRRAFGGSPDVLGKKIQAGSAVYTVVGVAADRFTGVLLGFEPDLITPLHHTPMEGPPRRFAYYWVTVFARRAAGVSQEAVAARMAAITPALLEQSTPPHYNQEQRHNYLANRLVVSAAGTGIDWVFRRRFGPPLYALLGICAALLLIGCLNVTAMLLARTLSRRRELAVRAALGATGWRVLRPLALESLLLALAGGWGGLLLASWMNEGIAVRAAAFLGRLSMDFSPGLHTWEWLGMATAAVAAVWIAIPAWQARRCGQALDLRGGRGIAGGGARSQKVLIGVQVAFTLALVMASGVFARSFRGLAHLPLGLRTGGVAEATLSPVPGASVADPKAYYASLLERVAALPNVRAASLSSFALYWNRPVPELVSMEGGGGEARAQTIQATGGYFHTIGVTLRAGGDFGRDRAEAEAIVSESVAQALGGGVIGRQIAIGDPGTVRRYRVIGVAPAMRISMSDAAEAAPMVVYLNLWQEPAARGWPVLFVQGSNGRAPDARTMGAVVQSLGRQYVEEYRTLQEARDESIVEDRLLAWVAGALGLLALFLAAVGLFAALSRYVAQRTSEIGLRMALGADRAQIHRLVLRQMAPVLMAGGAAGLGLVLALGKVLVSTTYGVRPNDPLLLACAVIALAAAALPAGYLPARRAAKIDPNEALRGE